MTICKKRCALSFPCLVWIVRAIDKESSMAQYSNEHNFDINLLLITFLGSASPVVLSREFLIS